jgi:hypothetical protein
MHLNAIMGENTGVAKVSKMRRVGAKKASGIHHPQAGRTLHKY